jgi:hypothetical protein
MHWMVVYRYCPRNKHASSTFSDPCRQHSLFQNDATVTLVDLANRATGVPVAGSFPVALLYVLGSSGDYKGILPHTLPVVVGETYTATFKAVSAQGYESVWKETVRAKNRTA